VATFFASIPDDGPQLGNPDTRKIFIKNFFDEFKVRLCVCVCVRAHVCDCARTGLPCDRPHHAFGVGTGVRTAGRVAVSSLLHAHARYTSVPRPGPLLTSVLCVVLCVCGPIKT
jgi:hypothetical protein